MSAAAAAAAMARATYYPIRSYSLPLSYALPGESYPPQGRGAGRALGAGAAEVGKYDPRGA